VQVQAHRRAAELQITAQSSPATSVRSRSPSRVVVVQECVQHGRHQPRPGRAGAGAGAGAVNLDVVKTVDDMNDDENWISRSMSAPRSRAMTWQKKSASMRAGLCSQSPSALAPRWDPQ
jgi:dienelactone hydrolase